MTDLYDVLNVSRGAPQEVIDSAYLALRRSTPEEDSAARERLEAAYTILGNATRRAEYDAAMTTGPSTTPDSPASTQPAQAPAANSVPTPVAPPVFANEPPPIDRGLAPDDADEGPAQAIQPPGQGDEPEMASASEVPPKPTVAAPSGGGSRTFVILAGLVFILIAGIGAALAIVLVASKDDGDDYPADLADDAYPLEAMGLRQEDMPKGMILSPVEDGDLPFGTILGGGILFSNEEWAQLLDAEDPEAKANQLNALGRVQGFVQFFNAVPTLYGYPIRYTSQSSLFDDIPSAEDAMRTDCDILTDATLEVKDIPVRDFADEATSFQIFTPTAAPDDPEYIGDIVETVVCFRTGRIVHSVTQQGFEGTEDLGQAIRLARLMLDHVNEAFGNGAG